MKLSLRNLLRCRRGLPWLVATLLLLLAGCATPEANPPSPSAKKGYADFYADPFRDIYWKIEQWDPRASKFKSFYSKFGVPTRGFLRLELSPGPHRFRISFVNLATEGPVEVDTEVVPGKITPIQVHYAAAADTYVRSVEDKARHGGRRREVTDYEHQIYRLSATAQAPEAYLPKEKMPYAH